MGQTRDGMDDHVRVLEIEFIGGPYDGHKKPCFTRPVHLPADVVWFVCEDAFRLLDGKDQRPGGTITSVALYKREIWSDAWRYRFARSMSVKELTQSMREFGP